MKGAAAAAHHENVAAMRNRTHGDFQRATMRRHRARL
jgi:hypothetical protein